MATRTVESDVMVADSDASAPQRRRFNPGRIGASAALVVLIVSTLFPFYWMARTAFSTSNALFSDPASLLPIDFTCGSFKSVVGLSSPQEARAEGGSGAS